jgi:hypothetical protein
MKTKQASKKNTLPNMAQKWPMLAMQNPMAETMNNTHPRKFIW